MASTSMDPSDLLPFPTEARRLPPTTSGSLDDEGSRYYIIGVLIALGLVLAVFLLWARWRMPTPALTPDGALALAPTASASSAHVKTRRPTRPPMFDVYIAPVSVSVSDAPVGLWTDMLPLSFSLAHGHGGQCQPPPSNPLPLEPSTPTEKHSHPHALEPPKQAPVPGQVATLIALPVPVPPSSASASSNPSMINLDSDATSWCFEFAVGTAEVEV